MYMGNLDNRNAFRSDKTNLDNRNAFRSDKLSQMSFIRLRVADMAILVVFHMWKFSPLNLSNLSDSVPLSNLEGGGNPPELNNSRFLH